MDTNNRTINKNNNNANSNVKKLIHSLAHPSNDNNNKWHLVVHINKHTHTLLILTLTNSKREKKEEGEKKWMVSTHTHKKKISKIAASLVCHAPLYMKKKEHNKRIHKGIWYVNIHTRNHEAWNKWQTMANVHPLHEKHILATSNIYKYIICVRKSFRIKFDERKEKKQQERKKESKTKLGMATKQTAYLHWCVCI